MGGGIGRAAGGGIRRGGIEGDDCMMKKVKK